MYPPHAQYTRLSTDPENGDDLEPSTRDRIVRRIRPYLRPNAAGRLLMVILLVLLGWAFVRRILRGPQKPLFAFDKDPRPSWLDIPPNEPLRMRVAIVSRPSEFDLRMAIRDTIFSGIREEDARVDLRFFVGAPTGFLSSWLTESKLKRELETHSDLVVLREIDDIKERLSEKRFAALKWGGSVDRTNYDWFVTLDSDTFVRFGALARRMPIILEGKNINPQNQSVLIGRMGGHLMYWENRVADGDKDARKEDLYLKGPWFSYPIGIGYMLSPFLVDTLLSMDPPPPHHIHYPNDDVMIGGWIAALKLFHDKSIHFETTLDHPPKRVEKVVPKPYLPEPVDTEIIDDKDGWHNYAGRQDGYDASMSWQSVCVHHVSAKDMRKFRAMDEIDGEWVSPDSAEVYDLEE
ncbi:hypothetical protein NMY22_g8558 [Coprinellus aureogranulatus]|nr:hypothetical protein NMY22_g8558 [Coprinellus aureogranulatus]